MSEGISRKNKKVLLNIYYFSRRNHFIILTMVGESGNVGRRMVYGKLTNN
jgi:hypothetical protein